MGILDYVVPEAVHDGSMGILDYAVPEAVHDGSMGILDYAGIVSLQRFVQLFDNKALLLSIHLKKKEKQ